MTLSRSARLSLLAVPIFLWGAFQELLVWSIFLRLRFNDFGRFYYAVVNWRRGGSLYDPTVATWFQLDDSHGMHLTNLNPPHVSLAVWPFTFLPLAPAFDIWFWTNMVALLYAAELTRRELGAHVTGGGFLFGLACVWAMTPTLGVMATGQFTGLLALLTVMMWRAARRERWAAAGAWLGVAWSVKLFYVPIVGWMFLTGRRREAGVSLVVGSALFVLGAAVFGWREELAWVATIRSVQWPWLPMNASVMAPFVRAAQVIAPYDATASIARNAMRLGWVAAASVALIGLWRSVRAADSDRAFLLLVLTCLLAFPVGWLYYWWIFCPLVAACWEWPSVRRGLWWSLPGWLIATWYIWPPSTPILAFTWGSIYTWSLLALWLGAFTAARRTVQTTRPLTASQT